MVLAASAGFDTMIAGQAYRIAASFTVTLPVLSTLDLSKIVTTIDCDCQNNTDLPDNLRDVEGDSVLGGTITLTGFVAVSNTLIAVTDLFNPDNAASPLYRHEIRGSQVNLQVGGQPYGQPAETLSKLDPGVLTAYSLNHADGTAQFTIADRSSAWKSLPATPSAVTAPPYSAGLTSEYVMDAIVRSQWGDSSWPATSPNAVLAVGLRSSLWADRGILDTSRASIPPPVFAPGPWGTGLSQVSPTGTSATAPGWRFQDASGNPASLGTTVTVDLLISHAGSNVEIDFIDATLAIPVYIQVRKSLGVVRIGCLGDSQDVPVTFPTGTTQHRLTLFMTFPTVGAAAYSGSVWIDGVNQGTYAGTGSSNRTSSLIGGALLVTYNLDATVVAGWQVLTVNTPFVNTFTPRAVIDPSLNPLVVPPSIDAGTAPMDELETIAAAELGYARVDEQGIFRFSNRVTLANRGVTDGTTPRLVSASNALKNLTTQVPARTQYNHIQVPYTAYTFGAAALVWTLDQARMVGVGQTVTWVQDLGSDTLAANLSGPLTLLTNGHSFSDGGNYYRGSTDPNGVSPNNSPNVTGSVVQLSGSTVRITITNKSSAALYLVSPSSYADLTVGTLALWIGGLPVTPSTDTLVDLTYAAGDALYQFPANPYLQDPGAAQAVGAWLLNQVVVAIRDFEDVDIVPDPRIQIGDLLHLQSVRALLDEYVRVWGWSFSASFPGAGDTSGGTWDMTLNVRALGPPGAWLGGIAGRSEGGITTYGYG